MANNIYLALYKGHKKGNGFSALIARFGDWLTRKLTKGIYSHCEIAIKNHSDLYCCYSSSIRDGGVRVKNIDLNDGKWDLIPIKNISEAQVLIFFNKHKGQKYDFFGALGVVFKTKEKNDRYFCSEFVGEILGLKEAWRFSPNDLAAIFKR